MNRPAVLILALLTAPAWADYRPDLARAAQAPRHTLPAVAVQKAVDSAGKRGLPQQFAAAVTTNLRLSDGQWQAVDETTSVWRLRLRSPDARSLNLELANLRLPEGSELRFYDSTGAIVQGPYTAAQVQADGRLWTALVPAEEAVLELRAPTSRLAETSLEIARVNHGYRGLSKSKAEGGGKSASCNIDVVCPQGDNWRDEIRSVALITIGGEFLCTGQLVNNARQDLTPYFLTADHCLIGEQANTPAESVVFYWNFQTSVCGSAPDGSLAQNQSGSRFIADDRESDFTLVQLAQTPLDAFNVYYSGFDVSGGTPQSGSGVHHPQGDEKRISLFSTPASETPVTIDGTRRVDSWRVVWSQGTTEQGSSGSGLWNQDRRLVGVLSGGDPPCQDGGSDYYGRLSVAWTASPQPNGQLKAHLDPDNSGVLSLPGRDPKQAAEPAAAPAPAPVAAAAPEELAAPKSDYSVFSGAGSPLMWLALLALVGIRRTRVV